MAQLPAAPKKRGRILNRSFWLFSTLAVVSGSLCYGLKGEEAFMRALGSDLPLLVSILPRIIAAMIIAGFIQALLPREMVARWVGSESGMLGLLISLVAGIITPGGPMASFPLVLALHLSGADRGSLVAYLTSWSLLGLQRILAWELPLLGPEFTALRVVVSLPLPIIAGLIARRLPMEFSPPGQGSA